MSKKILTLALYISLFLTSYLDAATIAQKPPIDIKSTPSKTTPNPAPFLPQIKALKSLPANISNAWQALYQVYLTNSSKTISATTLTPAQKTALMPLFSTNFFSLIEKATTAANFPKLANDPESAIHTNYATTHINKTAARLASISSIDFSNTAQPDKASGKDMNTPTVQFTGDNRDLGIIVNIQNNSQAQFSINQVSLDGKESTQIGLLTHGLNAVNLHTAALQTPASAAAATAKGGAISSVIPQPSLKLRRAGAGLTAKPDEAISEVGESSSAYYFEFEELDAQNPTIISLQMMTGKQLIAFLRTLPRKPDAIKKDTFEMNGLPTSPEYLANPKDYYFVLIQNPTPSTAQERNPDQRIQVINVSKLSGPYLLTMQINPFTIELNPDTPHASTLDIFQPSMNTVLMAKNKFATMTNFPFIILPQFLWNLPDLQSLWMLYTSTYIAALTNFKFLGTDTFANAFEYFKNLGFFDISNKCAFIIDHYNILQLSETLYDTQWLMGCALYETNLNICSDVPVIYSGQDNNGHITSNERFFKTINLQAMLIPKGTQSVTQSLFNNHGINKVLSLPQNQVYTLISNPSKKETKEGIFGAITEIKSGVYQLKWTNKKNKILKLQTLYLYAPLENIEITFVNRAINWVGSSVPTNLLPSTLGTTSHFKVNYENSPTHNKHILLTQTTSLIDKQDAILPLQFSTYPINNLYVDLYHTFKVAPYTRHFIIKNGIAPTFLESLSQDDWKSGIYLIPVIEKNQNFAIAFYTISKNLLGKIIIPNNDLEGDTTQFQSYTLSSSEFNPLIYLYLSTGVLLQYNQTP